MEFQQQATIFDYMEATADPRCSPPTAARLPEFSPTVASMGPYSTHVLYYPPPPPEATYSLPQQQQQQHQQAEPYYYYYPAGHASRQSPDLLSAKLSPPPTGLSMPPPPMCYGPYSPPCCCCAQLHYQHLQPRCSPDHLMFPQQQQQLPAAPVSEYIPALVPTLLQAQPPPPPPLQLHLATPMEKVAARATAEPGPNRQAARGGDYATRRRPPVLTEPQASGSWIQQDLQQRRRGGYMHNILYKTELCRDMQDRGACPRGRACQFAHSPLELQDPRRHPLYKTAFCYDFKNKGHCPRGERCFHVHEIAELREATALLPHVSVPSASGSARGGSSGGRGNSRHRRSPAAAGGSGWAAGASRPLLYDSSELGPLAVNGGSGRRAGKDAKPATTETSYRFLMRKLSSSKSSPGSTGRGPSVASIGGMDQASLEAKTRLIGLGVDGAERRILESAPRNAQ